MEIEYSNEVRGKVHAYRFADWEKKAIAKALKPVIKKLEKEIEKIDNDPENEGQVTFREQQRQLGYEIEALNEIISEFKK
jgi:hypothetical protein